MEYSRNLNKILTKNYLQVTFVIHSHVNFCPRDKNNKIYFKNELLINLYIRRDAFLEHKESFI